MKVEKKWLAVLSIGMGLPSAILCLGYVAWKLVEDGVLEKKIAFSVFFLVVISFLVSMVAYACKKKS